MSFEKSFFGEKLHKMGMKTFQKYEISKNTFKGKHHFLVL